MREMASRRRAHDLQGDFFMAKRYEPMPKAWWRFFVVLLTPLVLLMLVALL